MRRSTYKDPKVVLIFNGSRVLIAITRSVQNAASLTGKNIQSISFACTGKYIVSGGYYFRHLNPNILLNIEEDINTLNLEDYDKMCGSERSYYKARRMSRLKAQAYKRMNEKLADNNLNNSKDISESDNGQK